MQIVAVPLFSRDMAVEAYIFRYLKENNLFSRAQATKIFDGASKSEALEILSEVGLDAFTLGKPLFIPISDLMLLGNLHLQCKVAPNSIIFVFEELPRQEEIYIAKIQELRNLGFRFAINYPFNPAKQDEAAKHCNYIFLSQRPERKEKAERLLTTIRQTHPYLQPIAAHIYSEEILRSLYSKGYVYYEARFYRVPVTKGETKVSPLKTNAIRLINIVQDENFEFDHVSKIVRADPALTISLLNIVNAHFRASGNRVKTIPHAVAMLGQREVRKWVTTAVSKSMGSDRPNEITRISLIRAKFAENLAPLYEMAQLSGELFLMGLFSVLDVILEMPMEEALKKVLVSGEVKKALVSGEGRFAPVLKMVADYENASWSAVSRHMLVNDIQEDDLAKAYIDALSWYRNMLIEEQAPSA